MSLKTLTRDSSFAFSAAFCRSAFAFSAAFSRSASSLAAFLAALRPTTALIHQPPATTIQDRLSITIRTRTTKGQSTDLILSARIKETTVTRKPNTVISGEYLLQNRISQFFPSPAVAWLLDIEICHWARDDPGQLSEGLYGLPFRHPSQEIRHQPAGLVSAVYPVDCCLGQQSTIPFIGDRL